MGLQKIVSGEEIRTAPERNAGIQRVGKRQRRNVLPLLRPKAVRYQMDEPTRPVVVEPVRVHPLKHQKPGRRFSVLRYAVPAILIPVAIGIPFGREIADGIKEELIRLKVGRVADYDGNGVVDDNEKTKLYKAVFGNEDVSRLSTDAIYQRIRAYPEKSSK